MEIEKKKQITTTKKELFLCKKKINYTITFFDQNSES